jgi:hypothetical protein
MLGAVVLTGLQACTWVKPTEAGKQVVVAKDFSVSQCKLLGKTTTTVKHHVGVFDRNAEKVVDELTMLAQDEAAKMGGDTIVPQGKPSDGSQLFEVYRCKTGTAG